MKKSLILGSLLTLSTLTLHGVDTYTDNFDSIGDGIAIQTTPDWSLLQGNSFVGTGAGTVECPGGPDNYTLLNSSAISWGGEDFSFNTVIDTNGNSSGQISGVLFGYSSLTNFYRIQISTGAGALAVIQNISGSSSTPYYAPGTFNNSSETQVELLSIEVNYTASTNEASVVFTAVSGTLAGTTLGSYTIGDVGLLSGQFGLYSHYATAHDINSFDVALIPEVSSSSAALVGMFTLMLVVVGRRMKHSKK